MDLTEILFAFYNLFGSFFQVILEFIRPRPVITDSATINSINASEVIHKFETNYGEVHPDFFQGSFSQALDKAKNDFHFLMVILESDEHDSNDKFNRETLTSDILPEILQESQILVWIGNVKDPEALEVSNTLHATTYPFIAFFVPQPQDGDPGSSQEMIVVDSIQGFTTCEDITTRLDILIKRYEPSQQVMQFEREEREDIRPIHEQRDMTYQASVLADQENETSLQNEWKVLEHIHEIYEQQDMAYNASLLADQEKERKADELVKAMQLAEENAIKEELKLKSDEEKKLKWRHWALSTLMDEPPKFDTDVTALRFKLANGEIVTRRFKPDDTVEMMYMFVDTYFLREDHSISNLQTPPDDYAHTFDFYLILPFPRTTYTYHANKSETIKNDNKLWPSATLFVESIANGGVANNY